ncbi:hypothetical protein EJJ20_06620 [Pseudomonas poae]|nr:hypothetical protein EJJ20_06620 [Pseudomonas poae]
MKWCGLPKTVARPSRASPLPHLTAFQPENAVKCGSGLAREEALKANATPSPYGNKMVDPVVRRPDNSVCAFAASANA